MGNNDLQFTSFIKGTKNPFLIKRLIQVPSSGSCIAKAINKYFDVELPANVRFHGHEHKWIQSILPHCGPQSVFNYLHLWKWSLGRCRCQRNFNNSLHIWEAFKLLKQCAVEIGQGRLSFFYCLGQNIFDHLCGINCISFSRASASISSLNQSAATFTCLKESGGVMRLGWRYLNPRKIDRFSTSYLFLIELIIRSRTCENI